MFANVMSLLALLSNFGGPDLIIILLIVLVLFGAKKLPELARGMGRAVKEFSAARDEIERELSQSSPSAATQAKLLDKTGEGQLPLGNLGTAINNEGQTV